MSTCVHFWVVRNTATNGPKPVWISATKKTDQSETSTTPRGNGSEAIFVQASLQRESTKFAGVSNRWSRSRLHGAPHRQGLGAEEIGGGVAGASEDEPGGPAGEAGGAAGEAGGAAGEGGGAFARPMMTTGSPSLKTGAFRN